MDGVGMMFDKVTLSKHAVSQKLFIEDLEKIPWVVEESI